MNRTMKLKMCRKIALALSVIMLGEAAFPSVSFALTSGPSSPEFTSFEPVATTNMVNEFTGDFTYNLPVLSIPGGSEGGYALSLSYHSGETPESEASWVGYGWTLNPGSITRGKRGNPDDAKGETVTTYNKVPKNWTASVGGFIGRPEAFSVDADATPVANISANATIRYNNYRGFGFTRGVGIASKSGLVSLGYSVTDGQGSFSLQVNPAALLSTIKNSIRRTINSSKFKSATDAEKLTKLTNASKRDEYKSGFFKGSGYGLHDFSELNMPTTVTGYMGLSVNFSLSQQFDPAVHAGFAQGLTGSYSEQENIEAEDHPGYGYLYSGNALANPSSIMDFYEEKESTYNKRDRYLSLPFSNADQYSVTGEGIGGGFRLYSKTTGTFYPNEVESQTTIAQAGFEIAAGGTLEGGGDVGIGSQKLSVKRDWVEGSHDSNGNTGDYAFSTDMKDYFFRFAGDLGGNIDYGTDDGAFTSSLSVWNNQPGAKKYDVNIHTNDVSKTIQEEGRSSFIAYHTNSEMTQTSPHSNNYRAYQIQQGIESLVDRTSVPDGIGEIVTFNESGNKYVYGLPVYARNEKQMQYDLDGVSSLAIQNNYLAVKDISNPKVKVGEERKSPYATNYLLTEITTPDYIDRNLNGPDDNDFGGYTKFSYDRAYGDADKTSGTDWYHWRIPYNGLLYDGREMIDNSDDLGSFSSGDKEIYYLRTIETKTHIAVFVTSNMTSLTLGSKTITGSSSDREDGLDAADDNTAAQSTGAQGTRTLRKLERIELYAKPAAGSTDYKLVKTVRFDYDYSLCQGLPNASTSTTGKLTLKKVWFEYEGIVNARISPYKFEYNYPTTSTANYPSKYSGLYMPTTLAENPNYSPFNLDSWGNYQENGATRFSEMKKWVNQVPSSTFDPAAWMLKVIKLPSGGEIHVQYEQDDYKYVQNERALAMVSLKDDGDLNNKYYLNVEADLGASSGELIDYENLIKDVYRTKKIYFKILYALMGGTTHIGDCNTAYITGYVSVKDVGIDGNGLYIKLGSGQPFNTLNADAYELPRHVCRDYVKTEVGGKLKPFNNCNASEAGVDNSSGIGDVMQQLLSKINTTVIPQNTCLAIEPEHSYFRIPVLHAKKGGGVRVKRLLMYDKGIETGDNSLYGNEYVYKNIDGETSGVASNEPSSIREENALVQFLPKRSEQEMYQKITSGKDKEQFEGPIGESLLPSPSVGYSRVMVKSIHPGKTNTGFSVSEYFTTYDYPTLQNTDNTPVNQEQDWLVIPAGLVNYSVTNIWATQGYRFIISEMNGQIRSQATYGGDPDAPSSSWIPNSSSVYEYYGAGDKVKIMKDVDTFEDTYLGKETEVAFERKAVEDVAKDANVEIDAGVGLLAIPLPFGSAFPSISYTESKLRTHVMTKVVRYPAVVKSVTTKQDGISHRTEYIAFSPYTGKPVVTRTTDGYNGLDLEQSQDHSGIYQSYMFPAAQFYPGMGQRAANEGKVVTATSPVTIQLQQNSGRYELAFSASSGSLCDQLGTFYKGDLLLVKSGSGSTAFFNVDERRGSRILLQPSGYYNNSTLSNLFTGSLSSVEVIRSGRTNELNTAAGGLTTYGEPQTSVYHPMSSTVQTSCEAVVTSLNTIASGGSILANNVNYPGTAECNGTPITTTSVTSGLIVQVGSGSGAAKDTLSAAGGTFQLDTVSGTVVYYSPGNSCYPEPVTSIRFCTSSSGYRTMNVIATSAATFDHTWIYDATAYSFSNTYSNLNQYETGVKGRWRMLSSYAYQSGITGGSAGGTSERNYKDAGVFPMVMFNWNNTSANDTLKWLRASTITAYTPNGEAVEEKDALNIYSSSKFGYKGLLPYLVAANADKGSVQFESFENIYNSTSLEDGITISGSTKIDNTTAHSGRGSYKLLNNCNTIPNTCELNMASFTLTSQVMNKGLLVKLWVKDPGRAAMPIAGRLANVSTSASAALTFSKVASTGEWSLYEAKLSSFTGLSLGNTVRVIISSGYPLATVLNPATTVWLDDVRVQPYDAHMTAYVYDVNTLRLLTSFDDQHFGLYYQYNQEGQLVRKIVETEKGMKTVQETQYHTILENR